MKLIIWWLALLTILPLLYLGWWKKGWRLILGVTIVAILIASYSIPEEVISSLTQSEIEKEIRSKVKKIDELIHEASKQENNSEKIKGAKKIIKLEEELKDIEKKVNEFYRKGKIPEYQNKLIEKLITINLINRHKNQWVTKWSKELSSSAILFYGEDFNHTLTTKEYKTEERDIKLSENVINFDDYQEKETEEVKEKISEIIRKEDLKNKEFSIVFLKNINKISKQGVKELLSSLFGKEADASSWKYNTETPEGNGEEITPNLSNFVFVASSSNSDSKELNDLHKNFRVVEVPLSRNQLLIFILSGGIEIIIFFFLTKNVKKFQHEKLQQLD